MGACPAQALLEALSLRLHCLHLLLEARVSVSAGDRDGETALHNVAGNGRIDYARALLEAKASVEVKATAGGLQGKTPLDMAKERVESNYREFEDLLRQYGARD